MKSVLFRVDGSERRGTGHYLRCVSLAQRILSYGIPVIFVSAETTPALKMLAVGEGVKVFEIAVQAGIFPDDCKKTLEAAKRYLAEWIVVDGYHFGLTYQKILKKSGFKICFLDDYGHSSKYVSDFILNQNLYANRRLYSKKLKGTKLLLGSRYALIRSSFRDEFKGVRVEKKQDKNILLTLGGSDPENVTLKILNWLKSKFRPYHIRVVIGGSNPNARVLCKVASEIKNCEILRNVQNMAKWMLWGDLAICAGGTTSLELAMMGLPSLVVILASNQVRVAEAIQKRGLGVNLGWYKKLDRDTFINSLDCLLRDTCKRDKMSKMGRSMVDGLGADRVSMFIMNKNIYLRKVEISDCKLLWKMSNETSARRQFINTARIPFNEHWRWFMDKVKSPKCKIFIAHDRDDVPIGYIRFDKVHSYESTVSVSLLSNSREMGYGKNIIELGTRRMIHQEGLKKIAAYIKKSNLPSINAFKSADYSLSGTKNVSGIDLFCYTYTV